MTTDEMFTALRTWLMTEAGIPNVILSRQNAPQPDGDFAVLDLIEISRVERLIKRGLVMDQAGEGNSLEYPADEIITEVWAYSWSLDVIALNAVERCRRMKSTASTNAATDRLLPIVLQGVGDPRRLPILQGQEWQDRANIDFEARIFVNTSSVVGVIEHEQVQLIGE
jgi:hypothetical protein